VLFLLLSALRGAGILRCRSLRDDDLYLAAGGVLVAGYTVVGGAILGFPKHHCPGFPLLCIAAGRILSEHRTETGRIWARRALVAGVGALAVQVLLWGDLLYQVRFALRQASVVGCPSSASVTYRIATSACLAGVTWLAAFVLAADGRLRQRWLGLLLVFALSTNLGLVVVQNSASYQTGYNYGDTGTVSVAAYLQARMPPGQHVVAPGEVMYVLNRPAAEHPPNALWADADALRQRLAQPGTGALAVSVVTNTVAHVRLILQDPEIRAVLERDYTRVDIPPYWVWIRKQV
jgi:hypothetical protein